MSNVNEMSKEDLIKALAEAQAENQTLKKTTTQNGLKVSAKGALSIYGMGRFPVTLYKNQWQDLLGRSEEIKTFITVHDKELKAKPVTSKKEEEAKVQPTA